MVDTEKLKQLAELRDSGVLSESEFESEKKKIKEITTDFKEKTNNEVLNNLDVIIASNKNKTEWVKSYKEKAKSIKDKAKDLLNK